MKSDAHYRNIGHHKAQTKHPTGSYSKPNPGVNFMYTCRGVDVETNLPCDYTVTCECLET